MQQTQQNFLQFALQHGPWAALSVAVVFAALYGSYKLIRWVLEENAKREERSLSESIKREERLVTVIDSQARAINEFPVAMERVTSRLEAMGDDICDLKTAVGLHNRESEAHHG